MLGQAILEKQEDIINYFLSRPEFMGKDRESEENKALEVYWKARRSGKLDVLAWPS